MASDLYSYVCVVGSLLCLGASPGLVVPRQADVDLLQLKSHDNNIRLNRDWLKMKYNTDNVTFNLSSNPALGIGVWGQGKLGFTNSNQTAATHFATSFPGAMVLGGKCVTVLECARRPNGYCSSAATAPATVFVLGAYVRLLPCQDLPSQKFQLLTDCAVGCSAFMVGDGKCQQACDNQACNWDGLDCATPAPTPPTPSPTAAPSNGPSATPSSGQPSSGPSTAPASAGPSAAPGTVLPSSAPTQHPTVSPASRVPSSSSPSAAPVASILQVAVATPASPLIYLLLLLLLCCCPCAVFLRPKPQPPPRDPPPPAPQAPEPPPPVPEPPPLPPRIRAHGVSEEFDAWVVKEYVKDGDPQQGMRRFWSDMREVKHDLAMV